MTINPGNIDAYPPQPDPAQTPQQDSIVIDKLDGLKNTVDLEKLLPSELAVGQNIDIDDRGEGHRRRGQTQQITADVHSLFTTHGGKVFAVINNTLSLVNPDYSTVGIVNDMAHVPVAYVQVGGTLYFSSERNNGKIDLPSLTASPWGTVGGNGFWFSPVVHPGTPPLAPPDGPNPLVPLVDPDLTLPPINGRLFGNPPMATSLTWFNGRIYLACGRTVWATELYLYDYVDKTKNFRQFEEAVTGLARVEDGVYVGSAAKLYFIGGKYGESETRVIAYDSAVTRGSMIQAAGDMLAPLARLRPELPPRNQLCVLCRSANGILACFRGGEVFNLTRTSYLFPAAAKAATLFRVQDGMNTVVMSQDSEGTPAADARFSDHFDATIVRGIDRRGTGDGQI